MAAVLSKNQPSMAAVDLDQDRRNKRPRILTEAERERLDEYVDQIHYSSRYGFGPCYLSQYQIE